ncbi:MAG: DUF1322 family protein [Neptuniibacter sp.]
MTINEQVGSIFNFVTNVENYKYWFPDIIDIKSANDLKHAAVGETCEIVITSNKGVRVEYFS